MSTLFLTIYVLIWPAIVAVVLWVLVSAFVKEWREARRDGRPLI